MITSVKPVAKIKIAPSPIDTIDESMKYLLDTTNHSVIEDQELTFKKHVFHFIHININSPLNRIDEIREIA